MLKRWLKAIDIRIALGILVLVVLAAMLGYSYGTLGAVGDYPTVGATPTTVEITSPGSGFAIDAGVPVFVETLASGEEPFASVDLFVDGEPYSSQQSPTQAGASPIIGHFSWVPTEPGLHVLVARAHAVDGSTTNSDPTTIVVGDPGYAVEASSAPPPISGGEGGPQGSGQGSEIPPPQPPGHPDPVAPPGSDDEVVPGEMWEGGFGDLIPWIFDSSGAPDAPELVATSSQCDVILNIHDLSDGELGFRIYRSEAGETDQGAPHFVIGPNEGTGWIEVTDTVAAAAVLSYAVEAFNSSGSSDMSNPGTVDTALSGCGPSDSVEVITLIPVGIDVPNPTSDIYCYGKVGDAWKRIPEIGFFDLDGKASEDAVNVLDSAIFTLAPDLESQPSRWNCWGWQNGRANAGGSLSPLGGFDTPERLTVGVHELRDAGKPGVLTLEYRPIELNPVNAFQSPAFLGVVFDPVVTDPHMLGPTLGFSTETTDCTNRLPSSVKPDFRIVICHPDGVDIEQPGNLSVHPHQYLIWDMNDPNSCTAGSDCSAADMTVFPYSVVESGYRLYDLHKSESVPIKTFASGDSLHIVPLTGICGTDRVFELRRYIKTDQPMTFESRSPAGVRGFAEPCRSDHPARLKVEFTSLTFGAVDDGFDDDDIEIYGVFKAYAQSGGAGGTVYVATSEWVQYSGGWSSSPCEAEGPINDGGDFGWGCPIRQTDGTSSLANWKLSYKMHKGFGENVVDVETVEGVDAIKITVDLWDWDDFSGDDPVCVGSFWITKEPGELWSDRLGGQQDGIPWTFQQGDNDNASCVVAGRMWFQG